MHLHSNGPAPVLDASYPSDCLISILPVSAPLIKQLFRFQQASPRPPIALSPLNPAHVDIYTATSLPSFPSPNTPLSTSEIPPGTPPTSFSNLIRELKLGGAGVILWKHSNGSLAHIDSLCVPLYPCADAAHAEASGAAHAVLLAAKHYLQRTPSQILIKGDNRAVIDFMTHQGKYRRPDLQALLEEAQHVMAFSLPPLMRSYTPREFNRCADFLAGIARDFVKEHFSPLSLLSLSLPKPPSFFLFLLLLHTSPPLPLPRSPQFLLLHLS